MSKYGKRPRVTCPGCGKDVAKNVLHNSPRFHKCPHGVSCFGRCNAGRPCNKCEAEIGCDPPAPSKANARLARVKKGAATNAQPTRIDIDHARPIASIRELLGLTTYAVGKALGGAASACDSAERSGSAVQVSTVTRAAEALGYRVVIQLVRQPETGKPK